MRRGVAQRAFVLMVALLGAAIASGCGDSTGPDCSSTDTRRATVPTALNNGQPVATFQFVQVDPALSSNGACQLSAGDVNLVITSDASFTQSFTYTVDGLDQNDFVIWTASGSVDALGPGASINEGTIINTPFPVDEGNGVRVVLSSWSSQ